jgi:dihydropteroate synthase
MGIVNVTPDSFSDGGKFLSAETAVDHALALVQQGAELLDVGGESSRPGALPVPAEEELRRVLPVVSRLAEQTSVPLSVDTYKAEVARRCLEAGAHIVNDITGLIGDASMAGVVCEAEAGAIIMHMQGTPQTMQVSPHYQDVVAEIGEFFEARLRELANLGIAGEQIALDPGIGFGKTSAHNLELLTRLQEFQRFGRPICLGVSRKGFLGRLLDRPVNQRLAGSLAAVCYAQSRGAVQIVRVHDVAETRDAVTVLEAIRGTAVGKSVDACDGAGRPPRPD